MHQDQNKQEFRLTLIYAVLIGVLTVAYRMVPRYLLKGQADIIWNLMPVGALALFVGSRLRGWWSWVIPLGTMFIADLLLIPACQAVGAEAMNWTITPFIYGAFLGYVLLGSLIGRESRSPFLIGGITALGSVQFFLVTNWTSWAFYRDRQDLPYEKTFGGLIRCYYEGLPFLQNTLPGDLIFVAVFIAAHALLLHAVRTAPAREAV